MSHHHPCHFSSIHDSTFSFCFLAAAGAGAFIYGYVFNRQPQDECLPRGGEQKLMVILSYHPYSVLRPLLQILGPLCFDIDSAALDLIASHVAAWPHPSLGSPMDLPIDGVALRIHLPPSSDDLAAAPSPSANPFVAQDLFHKADLFAAFGILLHLWTLWELMILGKLILLVAPTPPQCFEAISAPQSARQEPYHR